ncbi:MAG TPA: 50S ribosomal protein L25/general stress protein Ctc [Pseudogracilibacillus sp.]|nr:50S ribosomal protein L25/general stress protein Ctc [Pseudogracilibacillus sp.]
MANTLQAKQRENLTRAATKQIRKDGYIPSIVYGGDKEPQTISVESINLLKTMRDEGRNAIISLDIDKGETVDVMVHDYQKDPLKGDVTHLDFYVVDMSEEMDVEVVLHLEGDPAGVKEGGILQQPIYELQVRAKPRDIPEGITVDVSALEIGDSMSVEELTVDGNYEFIDEPDATLVTILPPETIEEEEDEETEDAAVEPELVDADEEEEEEA